MVCAVYCQVLRLPQSTMQELGCEFPEELGPLMHEASLDGRRNMARMRWRMVWGKVFCSLSLSSSRPSLSCLSVWCARHVQEVRTARHVLEVRTAPTERDTTTHGRE